MHTLGVILFFSHIISDRHHESALDLRVEGLVGTLQAIWLPTPTCCSHYLINRETEAQGSE